MVPPARLASIVSWWLTPDGKLYAYVRERYRGLRGQWRVCLVAPMGRVYHYDEASIEPLVD